MKVNDPQQASVANILYDAAKVRADEFDNKKSPSSDSDKSDGPEGRTVHDTITLSEHGQKIVNLNRASQLAETIQDAPVDKNFAEALKQATDDVFRISKLFTQTIRSIFSWFK